MIDKYSYNPKFLTKNDKPYFATMGEMHYSRYPKKYWEESIYKIKAGGIDIVSCYTIWIHHEEIENEFDFSGDRNLREFIETCQRCKVKVGLRIGPWVHAEARNGGLPDWILNKDFKVRENNEEYFYYVERFYKKIFEQVEGLFLKDGGPIVLVQIENEYGHCGGLVGEEGEQHMKNLHQMAVKIGFDVPLYTATGWGGAVTGGLIPVMGGYCEAPWDQRTTEIEPSGNYIFTHERNDHNIGSDYGLGEGITFDTEKFPYLTAELGGGLQVTHHRRPVASAEDIGAMTLAKLGSGVNLLGYYMYHGGTNPKGKLTTLQESKATGYLNDLPELSYDFNASVKEFGQISETLKELKLITYFVNEFGESLCEMPAYITEDNPLFPTNNKDIRYSVRRNKNSGYLFVNNYQRKVQMAEHNKVFTIETDDENVIFPEIKIKNEEYFFYPFNMKLVCNNKENLLKKATATPFFTLNFDTGLNSAMVFYTDNNPVYDFLEKPNFEIITLTKKEAQNAWKLKFDKEYLVISESDIIESEYGYDIISKNNIVVLKVFPAFEKIPDGFKEIEKDGIFTIYKKEENIANISVSDKLKTNNDIKKYIINIETDNMLNDIFLDIDYVGDMAKIYIDGILESDNFYTGQKYQIGLKRFDFPKELEIEIYPIHKDDKIYLECNLDFDKNGYACELKSVNIFEEYLTKIKK